MARFNGLGFGRVGALGVLAMSPAVLAATSARDVIVRFHSPQETMANARETSELLGHEALQDVQILSSPSGVVRLRYDSEEAADRARMNLELSGEVESVAPNLLYRPTISYRAKPSKSAANESGMSFLSVPFVGQLLAPAGNPEVQLPSDHFVSGADPLVSKDWALKNIGMPSSVSPSSRSLIAAVIDTGIDYNHEDLSGALWRNPENSREVGYDFAHNHNRPYDNVKFDIDGCLKDIACRLGINQGQFLANPGHGTHCAGHVGAVAGNSLGIRGIGAGTTQVMGLKFFYDAGEENAGQGDDAAAIRAIDYAIQHGAKVISASWGGRTERAEAEKSELKQALVRAQKAGLIVVIAAGNDSVDQDKVEDPSYPAAYDLDNLIVVAATDQKDALADFSSYGARSVHIAAPGVKILSTTVGSQYSDVVARYHDAQGAEQQMDWDGTSMATPIVAGAVSLVWSRFPNEDYHQIRSRILKSARPVAGLTDKVSTGGVLNVAGALGQ